MVITKNLPTINDLGDMSDKDGKTVIDIYIKDLLLAHEAHAVEKMRYKVKTGILGDLSREYWRGYRNAIRALKGEEVRE